MRTREENERPLNAPPFSQRRRASRSQPRLFQHRFDRNKVPITFPQKLWKNLWKKPFPTLQVSDNFRLIAFCTRSRHTFQLLLTTSFRLDGKRFCAAYRNASLQALFVCLLIAPLVAACVKLPRDAPARAAQSVSSSAAVADETQSSPRVNINTATVEELEKLPGVGTVLASRIVEHRRRYGHFRRAEHLIIVRGVGDRRFRELRTLLTVE